MFNEAVEAAAMLISQFLDYLGSRSAPHYLCSTAPFKLSINFLPRPLTPRFSHPPTRPECPQRCLMCLIKPLKPLQCLSANCWVTLGPAAMTWRLVICAPWPHSNARPDILYIHRVHGSRFDAYLLILRSTWLPSSVASSASLLASPDLA